MAHQFKVGDRVRLTDANRDYAEQHGITGVLVIERIDGGVAHFTDDGDGGGACLYRLEPAPPAPALIDPAKTYQTRDGRAVRIYATDGGWNNCPIHGAAMGYEGWEPQWWLADGTSHLGDHLDLIEVKSERDVWIVWRRSGSDNYNYFMTYSLKPTPSECPNAVAIKRIVLTEGEGL